MQVCKDVDTQEEITCSLNCRDWTQMMGCSEENSKFRGHQSVWLQSWPCIIGLIHCLYCCRRQGVSEVKWQDLCAPLLIFLKPSYKLNHSWSALSLRTVAIKLFTSVKNIIYTFGLATGCGVPLATFSIGQTITYWPPWQGSISDYQATRAEPNSG